MVRILTLVSVALLCAPTFACAKKTEKSEAAASRGK